MTGCDLPQAGKPRGNVKAAKMLKIVSFEIIFGMRPWTDNAHITLEHIEELRQFINAVLAKETSQAGDAGIVHNLEGGAIALIHMHQAVFAGISISYHRAEFVAAEFPALAAHAPRFIENWPWRVNFHGDSGQ